MKRIFSSPVFALAVGFCLRLFFVLKFPADSGDTALYEQLATNWLKHHVFGIDLNGAITPVDVRMPGYPAFLALVYALTGRTGESARFWVMLGQIGVDLAACLVTACLAVILFLMADEHAQPKRVFAVALWLSRTMSSPWNSSTAACISASRAKCVTITSSAVPADSSVSF